MQGEPLNIQWKRGEFRTFYALTKIRVGGANESAIQEGDEFDYDGTTLKYSGSEFASPSLRGAFRAGWCSIECPGDENHQIPTKEALRNIAKSQSVNRDLSNVQRAGARSIVSDNMDEDTVLAVSDRAAVRQGERGHLSGQDNRRQASSARGMKVEADAYADQEAVSIGRVRTPSRFNGDITKSSVAGLKDKLENISGSGFIADKSAPVMESRRATGKTVEREGVTVRTSVGDMDRSVRSHEDDEGVVVGKTRHTANRTNGEVSVRDTSNIRNETKSPSKAAYKVNTKINPKVRVARAIDPSFPTDWNFEGKLADRMAAVKARKPTPEFLDALYAAEGDQMRRQLEKAYPKQFA